VILSGEEIAFSVGAFAIGFTDGPAGSAGAFVVPAPPKFKGVCDTPESLASASPLPALLVSKLSIDNSPLKVRF
jgi:hypothetical protein